MQIINLKKTKKNKKRKTSEHTLMRVLEANIYIYMCVCVRARARVPYKIKVILIFPPKPNVSKYWSSHNVWAKRSEVYISKIQKRIKLKPIIGNFGTCLSWWRVSQCCIWKARNWMQATSDRKQCSFCFEFTARASLRFFFIIFACACHIEVAGYCWKIKFW